MKQPSYLFGTIHLICKEDYVWTPAMKKSFAKANEVCMEMDMDDPGLMMEVAIGMIDNSGKKLKDYFTEEQYSKLSRYVKDSLGMDISMFQQMKPSALQIIFATKAASCANPLAYETVLTEEAKKLNKEVTGLESVSEQIALFNSTPADSIVNELMAMVEGTDKEQNEYEKLVAFYKQQDLAALHTYIQQSSHSSTNRITAFLDERNEKWIERMVDRMDKGPVFFAVGAGHLWGENGLITLLKKSGYSVVPVK